VSSTAALPSLSCSAYCVPLEAACTASLLLSPFACSRPSCQHPARCHAAAGHAADSCNCWQLPLCSRPCCRCLPPCSRPCCRRLPLCSRPCCRCLPLCSRPCCRCLPLCHPAAGQPHLMTMLRHSSLYWAMPILSTSSRVLMSAQRQAGRQQAVGMMLEGVHA
jgi:hypothetical protein